MIDTCPNCEAPGTIVESVSPTKNTDGTWGTKQRKEILWECGSSAWVEMYKKHGAQAVIDYSSRCDLYQEIAAMKQRVERAEAALQGLYTFLPRYSCKSMEPDDCPVCVARAVLIDDAKGDT